MVLGLLTASLALMAAGTQPSAAAFSTLVSIEPSGANAFVLKAQIKDAESGEVLAGPMLKMPAGEAATTETELDADQNVTLTATVDGKSRTAQYTITVKKGQKVVSEHTAKITL